MCSQEKGKGQPGAGRFFPFRRNAPAVLMNGFSLEAGLLLNALFATLFRDLQRVGACACHSIISLVHLKAFRSFDDVEHNTDLFCFTSFLHSLSNLTCLIYESLLHFFLPYHRFRWYATLENKTPAERFPKFPTVLHVIDRSDRNPPIAASSVTFQPSLSHAIGLWLVDFDPLCQ